MLNDTIARNRSTRVVGAPDYRKSRAVIKSFADLPKFDIVGENGAPKPVYVAIDTLGIDEGYQYHPEKEPGRIAKLTQWLTERGGFDEQEAGPIFVSRRKNGSLWTIDGGGRQTMAKMAGKSSILAIIKEGLSWEEEARFFISKNTNKRTIRAPHLFVVAANHGAEPNASILQAVRDTGYVIERTTETRKASVLGPTSLLFAYQLGEDIMHRTLFDLRHTWGDTIDGRALVALAVVNAIEPRKINQKHLREVLSAPGNTCDELIKASRATAAGTITTRSPQSRDVNPYFAYKILGAYNRNMKAGRLDAKLIAGLESRFDDEGQYRDVWRWDR